MTATTFSERVVARASRLLAGQGLSRRCFLARTAVVGSALTVDAWGFVLKPQTAYATVCGNDADCNNGWTAFCCTINDGANTCPPGSYAAGWWKVDDSAFCRGAARYYIDCNRHPGATCDCHCGDGECDRRRVCCNVFRYGQCNTQVPGVTEVVCRVILCTPPWEWDPSCTTTVRTDPATRTHSATCLPREFPSHIEIAYQDLGLSGSVLGRQIVGEADAPGGGRIAQYERGAILWTQALGAHHVAGAVDDRYRELGRSSGILGYPTDGQADVGDDRGERVLFEQGGIWWAPETGAWETWGPIHGAYRADGGPTGRLGYPTTGVYVTAEDEQRTDFETGWSIVHDPVTETTRVVRTAVEDGGTEDRATVQRWSGRDRIDTAAEVSRRTHAEGCDIVYVARADAFADALAGGVAAALAGAPVLLTWPTRVPPATVAELQRLDPSRIYLLGGELAADSGVEATLNGYARRGVERVFGQTRYDTAARISQVTFPRPGVPVAFIASGEGFADALAGIPAAAVAGGPILLTRRDQVPAATARELDRLRPDRCFVLGGTAVVSKAVVERLESFTSKPVTRLAGSDRYATAAAIVAATVEAAETAVIATGRDFPDGLAAGPAAVALGGAVLLVPGETIPEGTDRELRRLAPDRIVIVGGTGAVSGPVEGRLATYRATPPA